MSAKPCEACGAWWLPGSEKCPRHRPGGEPQQEDNRTIVEVGAPRVYPKPWPAWWAR